MLGYINYYALTRLGIQFPRKNKLKKLVMKTTTSTTTKNHKFVSLSYYVQLLLGIPLLSNNCYVKILNAFCSIFKLHLSTVSHFNRSHSPMISFKLFPDFTYL